MTPPVSLTTNVPEPGKWDGPAGYKRLIELAAPMLVSMGAFSLMQASDRIFLSWRSTEELAAVVPASAAVLVCVTLFFGTTVYTANFVAQYFGAGRPERIGVAIWAGIWVSLLGQIFALLVAGFSPALFELFHHGPRVTELEVEYFTISALGVGPQMASTALSALYSGQGRTRPVMWMGLLVAGCNIPLNYALIFGNFGAPEMGMKGAALSTVLCQWLGLVLWALLVFRKKHDEQFHVMRACRIDVPMLKRLLRFGGPNGMHFLLDGLAWTGFSLFIGRLGMVPLAASNIAWQLHTLALLPAIGIGVAGGILVGQFQGAGRPDLAQIAAGNGLKLALVYMGCLSACFLLVPSLLVRPFGNASDVHALEVAESAEQLLRFVACLGVCHTVQMVYASALKAAGDVRFIIRVLAIADTLCFLLPLAVFAHYRAPATLFWSWFVLQTAVVAVFFHLRFRRGAWRGMRLIEELPQDPAANETAAAANQ